MMVALWSVAAAGQAVAPAPVFAPPLDRPMRHVTEQERRDPAGVQRYRVERNLVFRRDGAGYLAELTILSSDGTSAGGPGAMFERAMASMAGVTFRYRLDAGGAIRSVDDLDAVWARLVDAIAAQAGSGPENARGAAIAARIVTPMRAFSPERRTAMLASMLMPVLAPDVAGAGVVPPRAVTMPGKPPFGLGQQLSGTADVRTGDDAMLVARRAVKGEIAMPTRVVGDDTPPATARMTIDLERRVDPRTGLVMRSVETSRTVIGDSIATVMTQVSLAAK